MRPRSTPAARRWRARRRSWTWRGTSSQRTGWSLRRNVRHSSQNLTPPTPPRSAPRNRRSARAPRRRTRSAASTSSAPTVRTSKQGAPLSTPICSVASTRSSAPRVSSGAVRRSGRRCRTAQPTLKRRDSPYSPSSKRSLAKSSACATRRRRRRPAARSRSSATRPAARSFQRQRPARPTL
ncbi:hypothetical protein M885DRAFT_96474 [Pelagophyceae sp. CCMP2097]|nr:hypothetical protein M885DRAFT_96474 [Pelagophyceae sp. CCMP2097]